MQRYKELHKFKLQTHYKKIAFCVLGQSYIAIAKCQTLSPKNVRIRGYKLIIDLAYLAHPNLHFYYKIAYDNAT